MQSSRLKSFMNAPEVTVAVLLFIVHLAWESLQTPFFSGMPGLLDGLLSASYVKATLGDVVIGLVAFWGAAGVAGDRQWFLRPTMGPLAVYFAIGLLITIGFEWYAVYWAKRWAYSDLMPIVPGLRVGWIPVLQWLVLPPIVLVLSARRFARAGTTRISTGSARTK